MKNEKLKINTMGCEQNRFRFLLLAVVLLLLNAASAQNTPFKINDSISGTRITALCENETYYWAATSKGLVRITKKTGKQRVFTTTNSVLPCNSITSLCARKNGHVWIGTTNGIVLYDGYCFFWMNTENTQIPTNEINSIAEDEAGILWIGSSKGLVKVQNNRFSLYTSSNSNLPTDQIKVVKNEVKSICFVTATDEKITSVSLRK